MCLHKLLNTGKLTKEFAEAFNEPLLEMANLAKSDTSLSMVVWIQVKQSLKHNVPRIKFANNHSDSMLPNELVPVSITDDPQILAKNVKLRISNKEFEELRQWIIRNKTNLLKVWNGEISTIQFGRLMK